MKSISLILACAAVLVSAAAQAQRRPGTTPRTIVECRAKTGPHQTLAVYITVPGLNPIHSATVTSIAHFGRNVLINGLRVQRIDNPSKGYVQFKGENFDLYVRTSPAEGLKSGKLNAVNSDGRKIAETKLACETN